MKEKLRCVGYIKPMDKMEVLMEKSRIPAIDVELQKKHICEYADKNGLYLQTIYEDVGNEDFSLDDAFKAMRRDALHRKFDMIIVDSAYCFGATTYLAAELFMKVYYHVGIRVAVLEDDFFSWEKSFDEATAYWTAVIKRYRSRQANITINTPGKESVVKKKYERRDYKPDCIIQLLPSVPEKQTKRFKRGNGQKCYDDPNIQSQLFEIIYRERKKAEYAFSKFPETEDKKAEMLGPYMEKAKSLWNMTGEYNRCFVELESAMKSGEITEEVYKVKYAEYMEACSKIENEYSKCRSDICNIRLLFDSANPWIKRFTAIKLPEKLDMENIVRWIKAFDIIDGKVVNCIFTYWEWRDALPDICKTKMEE